MKNPFDIPNPTPDRLFKVYSKRKAELIKGVNWWSVKRKLNELFKQYEQASKTISK